MREYYFSLQIPPSEWLYYYKSPTLSIVCTSEDGVVLQIPAFRFKVFVSYSGVQGKFKLTVDKHSRFVSLEKLK